MMLLVACASLAGGYFARVRGTGPSKSRLEFKGTVTYLERMLLPRVADVRITLLDTADRTEPKVIIEKLIPTEGRQVPIPFKLPLAPGSINPRHRYSVKAAILINGKVWFSTRNPVPVLTGGNPCEVDIVLDRSS
jgi:putative lipoprotein